MNDIILTIYETLQVSSIVNDLSSDYWIFQVDSVIVKEDGVSKRYLKILFLNRKMNEKGQLMRLYLNVDGELIEKDDFVKSTQYDNPNIMGFTLERDLIDESTNIQINGYVVNGNKVELHGKAIKGFSSSFDAVKFKAMREFQLLSDDKIINPYFDEEKWICACGYCNPLEDLICPICASKKEIMKQLETQSVTDIILSNFEKRIQISALSSVEDTVENIIQHYSEQYNISKEVLHNQVDIGYYHKIQEPLIQDYLQNKIASTSLQSYFKSTFDETLQAYIHSISNDVIGEEQVMQVIDVVSLRNEYQKLFTQQCIQNKRKKRNGIVVVFAILIFGLSIGSYLLLSQHKDEPEKVDDIEEIVDEEIDMEEPISQNPIYAGVVTQNNLKNRKNLCKDSEVYHDLASNLRTFAKNEGYCEVMPQITESPNIMNTDIDNKNVRAIDVSHVLVMDKTWMPGENIKDDRKDVMYIADLDGNMVYGDPDKNYRIVKFMQNNSIAEIETYVDGELYQTESFAYDNSKSESIKIVTFADTETEITYRYKQSILTEAEYSEKPAGGAREHVIKEFYTHDENGELIEKVKHDVDTGKDLEHTRYENGMPVEVISYVKNGDSIQEVTTNYLYDNNGLVSMVTSNDVENSTINAILYAYDFSKGTYTKVEYKESKKYGNVPTKATTYKMKLILPHDYDFFHLPYLYSSVAEEIVSY